MLGQRLDTVNYTPDEFYSLFELEDDGTTARQKRKLPDGTYVYENIPADGLVRLEQYDHAMVKVLAYTKMATELRRISVIPPANAVFCTQRADWISLGNKCRVMGGAGYGLISPSGTGLPSINGGAELSGSPARGSADPATYFLDMEDVFGVSKLELQTLADITGEANIIKLNFIKSEHDKLFAKR